MKLLNFGSLNLDYVYQVPHFVQPRESLFSSGYAAYLGGKGLNQSIALARAGSAVYHAGRIGENGAPLLAALREEGVNTDFLLPCEGPNGHAIIQVNPAGENCIFVYGGSNRQITRGQIDETLSHFAPSDVLLTQNEINETGYLLEAAGEAGLTIAFNPSPWSPDILSLPLGYVRYFLVNELEGAALAGKEPDADPETVLSAIRARYPNSAVILTLGGDGAFYDDGVIRLFQPAFPVSVKDTTAAGDTFTGYFLSAVCEGQSIKTALERAARAASISVSRAGASPSIPRRAEVL